MTTYTSIQVLHHITMGCKQLKLT